MIGTSLNQYRIVQRIGAGGMGEVYRAHDERLQRDVAIKVLPAASLGDAAARARLLREARAAAALNHPHICTIHEVGEAGGQTFIAMELVEGQPLDRLVPAGGFGIELVLDYGLQIADAVGHAHERGVLHRDLKTANVMVTPKGRAKVLDFGLAKRFGGADSVDAATDAQTSLTQAGGMIGTLAYMAPEQLRGHAADARSDVWALGVVLYEMATSERPFRGQTAFEMSSAILGEPPRPLPDGVPADLRMVIERCLAKEPRQRYAHAGELRAALEAIQAGTVPAPPRARRSASRRRLMVTASAAGALVLALVTLAAVNGGGLRRFLPGDRPLVDSLAVLPLDNLSGDPARSYLADGVQETLISELAQLPALERVIERRSTLRFRDSDKSIAEIARTLGVGAVVTGAVLWGGDRVSITARVIDAASEQRLWTNTYEADLRDVPALQKNIVKDIADSMKLGLTTAARERLAKTSAVDPATYEAYLRGMFHLGKGTREDRLKGIAYMQEAVNRDPGNAHAYAGLALGNATVGHGPAPAPDTWSRARAAAERAIKLDPDLAEGHAALADVKLYYEWDWAGAEREFRRANELNPNLAMNHYHYAWYLALFDRLDEAIAEHKRAQELDPLTPVHTGHLGTLYLHAGKYDAAVAEAKKSLEIDEKVPLGWLVLGNAYSLQGKHDDAIEAHRRAVAINPLQKSTLGLTYAKAGRLEEARTIVAELEASPTPFGAWGLIHLHTELGNLDDAFRWIEYRPHHAFLPWVRVSVTLGRLRKDPRFPAVMDSMKLPRRAS